LSLSDLRLLTCPHCAASHDLFALLDQARGSRPDAHRIAVSCPSCSEAVQLEIETDHVAIGWLSESGRREFLPAMRIRQPGLQVQGAPDGLLVTLLHRRWFVRAGS
jgi:hypothetical protein